MRKAKLWAATLFLALAGYGLFKGYKAQSKTDVPPKQTAYSYSNDVASGHVGTPNEGLEYKINFTKPSVQVNTKIDKLYTGVNFNIKTNNQSFVAETDVHNGSKFKFESDFKEKNSKHKFDYEKTIKESFLNSFDLSYIESIGKKPEKKIYAKLIFDIFGYDLLWSPGYDFRNEVFDLGKIHRL